MRFSIYFAVSIIVLLLFLAGAVSLLFALADKNTYPLTLTAVANIIAVILLVFLITRGILGPLGQVKNIMKKVGEGNLDLKIAPPGTKEMQELGDTLNEMIVRLRESTEKIKEVDRMKTEFVSLAAHQLRTPLSSVKWSLQMLLDGDMGPVPQQQKEFLSKTYASNERMINLVNDLLNATRVERGEYLYQPALTSIEDIIDSVVQLYQEEAQRKQIDLRFELPVKSLPRVLMDAENIRLALQNLVENAIKYTRKGGRVTISASHDTKKIEVSVEDTGIGIPKIEQQGIFQKFFRASNVKKIDTEGSGLGLYIARNIVEAHGGTIVFESEENKGTTFTFSIPITF